MRGLPTIPAVATILMWPADEAYSDDEAVASAWRYLFTEAAAESTKLRVSRWREHTADKERAREIAWAAGPLKQDAELRELGFL